MQVLRAGPEALLVDLDDLGQVDAVRAAVRRALDAGSLPGVVDVVPAARTVLVSVAPGRRDALDAVRSLLATLDPAAGTAEAPEPVGDVVELPVHYDGEDLELVAADAHRDIADVVALHTGTTYTVAFGGFAPGFAYLSGLPAPLCQARLDTPRPRIPAGSVGVAGEFSGVYPRTSPGGWRLIGRLAEDAPVLFDAERDPPALLVPGVRVRFRDVAGSA